MRTDSKVSQRDISTIIDLDKRQFVTINHEKKEAEITDMSAISKSLEQITAGDMTVTMTPTGNKKEVMGYACEEYTLTIKVPFQAPPQGGSSAGAGAPTMTIAMGGPACLSKSAPGRADYAAFYGAAAEKGLFISDPRQAKASPGQAKGMVEMYREMAKAGMPLTSDLTISFEGGGPLAGHDDEDGQHQADEHGDEGSDGRRGGLGVRDPGGLQGEGEQVGLPGSACAEPRVTASAEQVG